MLYKNYCGKFSNFTNAREDTLRIVYETTNVDTSRSFYFELEHLHKELL